MQINLSNSPHKHHKNEKKIVISVEAQKSFERIAFSFKIKTLNTLGIMSYS